MNMCAHSCRGRISFVQRIGELGLATRDARGLGQGRANRKGRDGPGSGCMRKPNEVNGMLAGSGEFACLV